MGFHWIAFVCCQLCYESAIYKIMQKLKLCLGIWHNIVIYTRKNYLEENVSSAEIPLWCFKKKNPIKSWNNWSLFHAHSGEHLDTCLIKNIWISLSVFSRELGISVSTYLRAICITDSNISPSLQEAEWFALPLTTFLNKRVHLDNATAQVSDLTHSLHLLFRAWHISFPT